jgi:hypothetical protein
MRTRGKMGGWKMAQEVNPPSFRVPPNLKGLVHPDVEQTIYDHDQSIVDLNKANKSLKSQITAMQASIAALQKGS